VKELNPEMLVISEFDVVHMTEGSTIVTVGPNPLTWNINCTVILQAYERFISRSWLNRYTHASLGLKYKPMALMPTPDECAP
jgi:hypothetical protein